MEDAISYAQKIENMIQVIDQLVDQLDDASMDKANGIANYDRAIAITILKIKNGEITQMEDFDANIIPFKGLPATLITQVAKGICWKEIFDKEAGDAGYKGITTKIEARKAQLNGYQSINKIIS
jgi:hypothetical protein